MNFPNILFLADTTHHTRAVADHITAVTTHNNIHWHVLNPLTCKTIDQLDFSLFDGIGIHYSIKITNSYYLSDSLKNKIAEFKGVKFLFLQDEYQNVNHVQELLYTMGFHILFTLVQNNLIAKAYPDPRLSSLRKVQVLTGYVHPALKLITSPPISERTIDTGYRARPCEYWLGALGQDKNNIATEFINRTKKFKLKLDISLEESDRLYGDKWLQWLMNCKAVLGTESGASIWDFDNSIQDQTKRYLRKHKTADFTAVYENILKPYDGNILYHAISPRIFEAAATKTPMIMFPGYYSGVCKADEHYIVLNKDFSNLSEILDKLKKPDFLQELADRTYRDLILSETYSELALSKIVGDEVLGFLKKIENKETPSLSLNLNSTINKHKFLNGLRCLYTEIKFIMQNFINIITDPRHSFFSKIKTLVKGAKRYLDYLLPRLGG